MVLMLVRLDFGRDTIIPLNSRERIRFGFTNVVLMKLVPNALHC